MELEEALGSRPEVLATFAKSGRSPHRFEWISEMYAGCTTDCGHARPVFGCCQDGEYMAYLDLSHVLHILIEGDLPLENAFFVKTTVKPASKHLAIVQMVAGDKSVSFHGIHYLRSVVGPPLQLYCKWY